MQYAVTLPADYDMGAIRRRVAERAAALDRFEGLGLKAYLIRERAHHGSPVNQYAPFYLWNGLEGMNRFLFGGGGFRGIVEDFGRPAVEHWTGLAFERGPAFNLDSDPGSGSGAAPSTATRRTVALGPDRDPEAAVGAALGELAATAREPATYAAALAIDARAWRLVHFTLWAGPPAPGVGGTRFEVLRVNTPGAHALPTGRHW